LIKHEWACKNGSQTRLIYENMPETSNFRYIAHVGCSNTWTLPGHYNYNAAAAGVQDSRKRSEGKGHYNSFTVNKNSNTCTNLKKNNKSVCVCCHE